MSLLDLLLILFSAPTLIVASSHCFPGLHYQTPNCTCSRSLFTHLTYCKNGSLYLLTFYYATNLHHSSSVLVAGASPYFSGKSYSKPQKLPHYNHSSLTEAICRDTNRNDTLCSRCMSNYTIAANRYDFKCIHKTKCQERYKSIILYLLVQFGPLTVLYLIIFLFRINLVPAYISLIITYIQCMTTRIAMPFAKDRMEYLFGKSRINDFLIFLYSLWNLDVYMSPVCLRVCKDNLTALSMQYIVAFYPLLLVLVTYVLAELHARRWWCVFWPLWPIVKLMKYIPLNIDPMRSIITTFAGFVHLSLTKFTIVSVNLVSFTTLITVNGTVLKKVPLFDAKRTYLDSRHMPFVILASVVAAICVVLPLLLLLLSPLKCFERCIRSCCCSFKAVHFVNAILEVFQGHLKDGVSHPRDYRFVAGIHFIVRVGLYTSCNLPVEPRAISAVALFVCIIWTVTVLGFKPYKNDTFNKIEAIVTTYISLLLVIGLYGARLTDNEYTLSEAVIKLAYFLTTVTPSIILVAILIGHIVQLCGGHKILKRLFAWLQSVAQRNRHAHLPAETQQPHPYTPQIDIEERRIIDVNSFHYGSCH